MAASELRLDVPRQPGHAQAGAQGRHRLTVGHRPGGRAGGDRQARWLTVSMIALAVLAAAAAIVSYAAQYRMVYAAKATAPVAALEAAIPDVAALIFATLGIALALHGRRAIRARVLNLGAVATSVGMNVLAAGAGWRDLAIWAMPPVAYALASDTEISVVRTWTIARQRVADLALADDGTAPLAALGSLILWSFRLVLAPASTLAGFRTWVLDACPVPPARQPSRPAALGSAPPSRTALTGRGVPRKPATSTRAGTKTERFLALVAERHGPLAEFPLPSVARVCAELAPEADLHPGAARAALRRHVLAAQNGSAR